MSGALLKKLAFFAAALLLLWVVYLYRQVPHAQSPYAKAVDEARSLELKRQGQSVVFEKPEKEWKVKLATGELARVDESPFNALLSSLKNVKVGDEISSRADRHADYEVHEASGTRVTFRDGQAKVLVDGFFGKQAADYLHMFYRFADAPEVYMVRGLYRGELGVADPLAWRSRQLVDIPDAEIGRIQIERQGKKMDYVRLSSNTWALNGKTVASDRVHQLVGTLAHWRADSFVTPADQPTPTFENLTYARVLVSGNASTIEVRVGPLDKKAPRYPLSSGKDNGVAWLSQSAVDSILTFQ